MTGNSHESRLFRLRKEVRHAFHLLSVNHRNTDGGVTEIRGGKGRVIAAGYKSYRPLTEVNSDRETKGE